MISEAMGRKKIEDRDELLIHRIRTRVNDRAYKRLTGLLNSSNCQTVGQLVRKILSRERITVYHKDKSLDGPIQELIQIRNELRAIGVNINQITHHFHTAETTNQRMFDALKVAESYREVGDKVNVLVEMVAKLGEKWLQR
jgi:hypothetical protein